MLNLNCVLTKVVDASGDCYIRLCLHSEISALAEAPDAIVLLAKEAEFSFSRLDLADVSLLDYPNQFTDEQLKDLFASGRSAYGGANGRLYRTTNSNNGAGGIGLGQFLAKLFGG